MGYPSGRRWLRRTGNGKSRSRSLRDDKQKNSNGKGNVWGRRVYRFPTRRPIRRAKDGAPGGLGLVEEDRQRQEQKQIPAE